MVIPTILLLILGCLGALDIVLFHSVAHGIRSHPHSVRELMLHSLRGPTYATLFVAAPNFELHGMYLWGFMALLVFDVGVSVADFWCEQESREFLGGLPGGEYVLHMLIAMVFGAFVAAYISQTWSSLSDANQFIYTPTTMSPSWLRILLIGMAIVVFYSGIEDAKAALRLYRRPQRPQGLGERARAKCGRRPRPELKNPTIPFDHKWTAERQPKWMITTLCCAGIYNLCWGAWVVLFPAAIFRMTGIEGINYPQIWQCVGMIVGVYGIGYLIAAGDPLRHWPIIFVGLLGKVLGPLGMVSSIFQNALPPRMLWVCITNDLIWWFPFAIVLKRAWLDYRNGGLFARIRLAQVTARSKE